MKPNWSVVIIMRNEEHTLPRLGASLKEFLDRGGEWIAVDTGSTDKTVEVAKALGAKVTEVGDRFVTVISQMDEELVNAKFVVAGEKDVVTRGDRLFDYASARNFAVTLSTNDLISMPDADEAFTKLDIDKVAAAINAGAEQLEYNFVFSHDQAGNPVIAFRHCKFYDRRKLKWTGIVHEVLTGSANRVFLDEDVIKLEHWQNEKTNRSGYLKGLALDCFQNPDNDRNSHYFGREMVWTGRPKSGIKELMRHYEMKRWDAERSQSAIFIGDAFRNMGSEQEAIDWYRRAIDVYAARREPFIRLAELYQRRNDPQRCAAFAAAALTISQSGFYADDASHYRHVPHELLAWALFWLGKREEAKSHFEIARAFWPNNPRYLHDQRFYDTLPKVTIMLPCLNRPEGLEKVKKSIENLIYPKESIELLIEDGPETVPQKVAKMFAKGTGDVFVYAADDTEFTPESLMIALNYSKSHNKGLVAFNTGEVYPDKGNVCEHFLIKRELVEKIGGEIFCTRMKHLGVDNLLWAKASKLDEAGRCDEAIIHHYHFTKDKTKWDATYEKAWSHAEEDRAILAEELAKLEV